MEKSIKVYEKFIAKEVSRELSDKERERLFLYHSEMVANYQRERLVHLVVTLFFALFAIAVMFVTAWMVNTYGLSVEMAPLFILTAILVIMTGFYVRHYYFLENHIQGLYKYAEKLLIK